MTSRAPDLETILERLEKIEDENRFLKRMGLLILLVSGASLTVGPTVGSFGRGQRSQRLEPPARQKRKVRGATLIEYA